MRKWVHYLLVFVFILALTGCGKGGTGAGMSANSDHSGYDRDSRNNENPTLGVKNRPDSGVTGLNLEAGKPSGRVQLDSNNPHSSETMRFDPTIEQELSKIEGVESARVILTEVNAYVAVVLKGVQHPDQGKVAPYSHQIDNKSGRGLFGSDLGLQMNWNDQGGLTMNVRDEIIRKTLSLAPPQIQKVYVTANPNFAARVQFYSEEEKRAGNLLNYKNEFNTLVQHAFPADANTRK